MTKKLLFGLLILALIAVPLFAIACGEEEPTPSQEEEEEQPPAEEEEEEVTGNWWDEFGEPQYGDTLTLPVTTLSGVAFDPSAAVGTETELGFQFTNETLFWWDWTADRDSWAFQASFIPEEYAAGLLAESWEVDSQTLTVYLREGIHWHNIEPVNGREFVASDVVEHYNRLMGWGNYTEPNPQAVGYFEDILESVTAPDDHTVVFTFTTSSVPLMFQLLDLGYLNAIEAPEAVAAADGLIQDWEDCVGTGPWIISDYVADSSLTFSANPDYYGYDERYPENQVPYVEELKLIVISEQSTQLAALRSGQIDYVGWQVWGGAVQWQQALSLAETNPELVQTETFTTEYALLMRVDNSPFDDMRIRQALQLAINLPEIAESYYGGTVDGIPAGQVSPTYVGWCYAYDEWPQSLKDEYSYDPDLSKQLLAEAAADGVFEPNDLGGFDTTVLSSNQEDLQLLQVVQSYFLDIGVDMEIETLDSAAAFSAVLSGDNDQLYWAPQAAATYAPTTIAAMRYSQSMFNFCHGTDAAYDEAYMSFQGAMTTDEAKQAMHDMDQRNVELHWSVYLFPRVIYTIYQPYLMGYSGEQIHRQGAAWARVWIDQDIKTTLGY